MHTAIPLACFLSLIRPPGIEFENSLLQIAPVDKAKCPFVRNTNDVGFQLYTRRNPTVYQELMVGDDEKLSSSNIDFNDHTVLYFHAFMENPNDGSAVLIREAYMLRGDTNVIMVDAQRLEAGPWYFTAAENTWYIGRFAGQFIDYLVARGLDLSKTHLVGHSLGAQAAGVAGAALTSGRVSRITGLDPALPLFGHLPLEQRLDPSDADFVDVIHTDGGIFGVNNPTGHVDFYPNGGISPQPGCELEVVIPQQLILNKSIGAHISTTLNRCYDRGLLSHRYAIRGDTSVKAPVLGARRHIWASESIISNDSDTLGYYTFHLKPLSKPDKYRKSPKLQHYNSKYSARKPHAHTEHEKSSSKTNTRKFKFEKTSRNATEPLQNTQTTSEKSHVVKRQKRFLPFLRSQETRDNNLLFKLLQFAIRNPKLGLPVFTVMREINTMVRSANGELNHSQKERNNYVGGLPANAPITYALELGNEGKIKGFVKRLLGLSTKGDKLTISGGK